MEKVIFKSKGVPTTLLALKGFLFLVFTLLGAGVAIVSAKNNEAYQYFGMSNDKYSAMMWLGIIMVIAGVAVLIEAIISNSQGFTVYDRHIEGTVCKGGLIGAFQNVNFNIEYNQIANVQMVKKGAFDYIEIITSNQNYKIAVKGNINEAYNAIRGQLMR